MVVRLFAIPFCIAGYWPDEIHRNVASPALPLVVMRISPTFTFQAMCCHPQSALEDLRAVLYLTISSADVDGLRRNNTIILNPTTVLTAGYGSIGFQTSTSTSMRLQSGNAGLPRLLCKCAAIECFSEIFTMQTAATQGNNNPGFADFYSRSVVAAISRLRLCDSIKAGLRFSAPSVRTSRTTASPTNIHHKRYFSESCRTQGISVPARTSPICCWYSDQRSRDDGITASFECSLPWFLCAGRLSRKAPANCERGIALRV